MRKYNLFGKKNKRIHTIYIILIIFVIEILGFYAVTSFQQNRINALLVTQESLQNSIDYALQNQVVEDSYTIDEFILTLPSEYSQFALTQELDFVRNLSGLADATNYSILYDEAAVSPFDYTFVSTFKSISIQISMRIDDSNVILQYIENLQNLQRFYYIGSLNVVCYTDGSGSIQMTIYTFYNNIP
jgi:hypothetical protein